MMNEQHSLEFDSEVRRGERGVQEILEEIRSLLIEINRKLPPPHPAVRLELKFGPAVQQQQ